MVELVAVALSSAFLDVGVVLALVAVLVLLVGPRCGGAAELLRRRPRLGPVLGAALGVLPGCSGALVVTPLFARGHVSLGTLVATLVATTGDSAWAMWAGAPGTAVLVHTVTLVLGVVVGCAVDAARASAPRGTAARELVGAAAGRAPGAHDVGPAPAPPAVDRASCCGPGDRSRPASRLRPAPRLSGPWLRSVLLAVTLTGFWTMTGAGAAAALGAQVTGPDGASGLTGLQLVGLLGFTACAGLLVRARGRYLLATAPGSGSRARRLLAGLDGAATQAAFVIVWVGVAYAVLALLEVVVGGGAELLQLDGMAAVLVGTLVGALPGCGLQIAWVGLYLDGAVGLPGLLANAVAQDGDALLPLLVLRRRLALGVTALTSVPALLVGTVAVLL